MPEFFFEFAPRTDESGREAAISSERAEESSVIPVIAYAPGQTLAQAIYLSGLLPPPALCSGLALCGRCRVRILSAPGMPLPPPLPADEDFFSGQELEQGFRLGCRHLPQPGMRVAVFQEERAVPTPPSLHILGVPKARRGTGEPADAAPEPDTARNCTLAVDLGTTSLQWRLCDFSGTTVRQGGEVNPQMGAGSDVLSRLAAAREPWGREQLSRLTLEALRGILRTASDERGPCGGENAVLCLAANPAMTAIALGVDSSGLAASPYSLPEKGGRWLSLDGLPPVWLPPQLSPFVGGDTTAGYASLVFNPDRPVPEFPFLLADMGTNGEFLLALSERQALAGSVALGPALEGMGLSCGSEARPGAVADFALGPGGLAALVLPEADPAGSRGARQQEAQPVAPPGGTAPVGITGTGYIALLHILLNSRIMDRDGRFTPEGGGPLRRFFPISSGKSGAGKKHAEAALALPGGFRLTASDVEEVLKVKAAFSLGLRRLLESAGVASHQLARVYLAGALGGHARKEALENLGFFPPGMAGRLEAVGNSALEGAALLARNEAAREALVRWAEGVDTLDLAVDAIFVRDYAAHMRFVW